jgi:hypothetical protein
MKNEFLESGTVLRLFSGTTQLGLLSVYFGDILRSLIYQKVHFFYSAREYSFKYFSHYGQKSDGSIRCHFCRGFPRFGYHDDLSELPLNRKVAKAKYAVVYICYK